MSLEATMASGSLVTESGGRFILLHERDNVLVCCGRASAGDNIQLSGQTLTLSTAIELGHKIALRLLHPGEKVLKLGVSIGSVTKAILPGELVHVHNMKSDYIFPHSRTTVS